MKNLTIPLLVLLVSGGLWAQNPEQAVNEYFDYFNNSDKDALNNASDSPLSIDILSSPGPLRVFVFLYIPIYPFISLE